MSDRIKGLTVTLTPNLRDDDAEFTINAIKMIKGVVNVVPHVEDANHHFAVVNAKREMREAIRAVVEDYT